MSKQKILVANPDDLIELKDLIDEVKEFRSLLRSRARIIENCYYDLSRMDRIEVIQDPQTNIVTDVIVPVYTSPQLRRSIKHMLMRKDYEWNHELYEPSVVDTNFI